MFNWMSRYTFSDDCNFKLDIRKNYGLISCYIIFLSSQIFNLHYASAAEKKIDTPIAAVETLKIIPRIKVTEINSLKSYAWWENDKPKIPKVYKLLLGKIKRDFLLENYNIEYVIKKVSPQTMPNFNGSFMVFGTLLIDANNPKFHELRDLTIYQIKNGAMNMTLVSSLATLNLQSSFRTVALDLKDRLNPTSNAEAQSKAFLDVSTSKKYLLVFENELSFSELNSIKEKVKETLNLESQDISLLYSEENKYTFQLRSSKDPEEALKSLTLVNGPYNVSRADASTIVFKTLTDELQKEDELNELEESPSEETRVPNTEEPPSEQQRVPNTEESASGDQSVPNAEEPFEENAFDE